MKRKSPELWKARILKASLHRFGVNLTIEQILDWMMRAPVCTYCGEKIPVRKYSVDHIVPRSRGGPPDDLANLQLIDEGCNLMKGNMLDNEFRDLLAYLSDKPVVGKMIRQRLKASGYLFSH
ncbi:MAG: HNH endonuclease [Nitrososphaerota archaeon]|jgi:5-methylcytosine-specific restriction endonuclease McrA|nr:HNH endonuclease [Nitrososphaerota archaeon]